MSDDPTGAAATFSDNAAASRYELRIGGELIGSAEYAEGPGSVSITRVFTRPTHRGRGLAADLMEYAVEQIVASGKKVVPVCSYAAAWYTHHPELKDTLT